MQEGREARADGRLPRVGVYGLHGVVEVVVCGEGFLGSRVCSKGGWDWGSHCCL